VTNDFGFVTLDINSTVAEDSGVYTCKGINRAGEAVSSTSMKIKRKQYKKYFILFKYFLKICIIM